MKHKLHVQIIVPITVEKIGKVDPDDGPLFFAHVDMNGSKRIHARGETADAAINDLRGAIENELKKVWW